MHTLSRRDFLRVSVLASATTLAGACVQTPAPVAEPVQASEPPAASPGEALPVQPARYSESPTLADLVAAGQLPPVDERLPENPCVFPVFEMTGKYGGKLRRGFTGVSDRGHPANLIHCGLTHFNEDYSIRPNICESWEMSSDATTFTIHLRKGARWSDGHPFDSSAISWWYNYQVLNPDITPVRPAFYCVGDPPTLMELDVPDDYTVVMRFSEPYPMFMHKQNTSNPFVPGHYMERYHLDFTDDKEGLVKEAENAGFSTWYGYFNDRNSWWINLERPSVTAWFAVTPIASELCVMDRNPYFMGVDADGRQLPYIDAIQNRLFETPDVLNLWVLNGEIDLQGGPHISVGNYTLFKENEELGDYRVLEWKTDQCDDFYPNHTCKDPRVAAFFQNRDVRIGMSHAIDRDAIVEMVYDGLAVAANAGPATTSPEYHEPSARRYTEYDPDLANEHLDQAGYMERDDEGYRLWNDGSGERVFFSIDAWWSPGSPEADSLMMLVQYLDDVGIKAEPKLQERSLYTARYNANDVEACFEQGGHKHLNFLVAYHIYVAEALDRPWGCAWGRWYRDRSDPNAEPPPEGHWLWKAWDLWAQLKKEPDGEKRLALFHQVLDIWTDELPAIGILGEKVGVMIQKNGLRNFGGSFLFANALGHDGFLGSATYFWDEPEKHMG